MPPDTAADAGDLVTLRLEFGLRAELASLADRDHKSMEDLLRELARAHVAAERRRAFEAEARRQCQDKPHQLAERAKDAASDEAEVLRWIERVADTDGWEA